MSQRTILTLADGRNIDLLNPQPSDFLPLDWAAEHLAKENRYNGATPGVAYSVASHLCACVDAALAIHGDSKVAAYCALHDVHEALLKDDTTPKKHAIAAVSEARFGVLARQILDVFDELTDRHDRALHEAVGLAWPPSAEMAAAVKHIDRVLLVTEWRDLMGGVPLPNADAYAGVQPLRIVIAPLSWRAAAEGLKRRWAHLLPALQKREG